MTFGGGAWRDELRPRESARTNGRLAPRSSRGRPSRASRSNRMARTASSCPGRRGAAIDTSSRSWTPCGRAGGLRGRDRGRVPAAALDDGGPGSVLRAEARHRAGPRAGSAPGGGERRCGVRSPGGRPDLAARRPEAGAAQARGGAHQPREPEVVPAAPPAGRGRRRRSCGCSHAAVPRRSRRGTAASSRRSTGSRPTTSRRSSASCSTREDWHGFWFARLPSFGGSWAGPHAHSTSGPATSAVRIAHLVADFDGRVLEQDRPRREAVVDLFATLAAELGAFFGAVQVEPGWTVTRNNRLHGGIEHMEHKSEHILRGLLCRGCRPCRCGSAGSALPIASSWRRVSERGRGRASRRRHPPPARDRAPPTSASSTASAARGAHVPAPSDGGRRPQHELGSRPTRDQAPRSLRWRAGTAARRCAIRGSSIGRAFGC